MSTPFYDLASLVVVPSGYKSGKIYAQKPLTTDGHLTFTRASTATRVNASGLIETVSSGVPRLDYLGSSCPKLLLEPQRTNYVRNNTTLTAWLKTEPTDTISTAAGTSPDGTNNAIKLIPSTASVGHQFYDGLTSQASGGNFVMSCYAKAGGLTKFGLRESQSIGYYATFNLSNGTVIEAGPSVTASIQSVGNGWYRCVAVVSGTAPVCIGLLPLPSGYTSGDPIGYAYAGNGTDGVLVYQPQLEVSSTYVTSPISTNGVASATRLADFAKKENIGGTLPTAYPFTLYSESDFYLGTDDFGLSMIDIGTTNTYYTFGTYSNKYIGVARSSAGEIVATSTVNYTPGLNKIAVVFTSSSIKVFANGALVATATNTISFSAGVNDIIVGTLREAADIGTRNSLKQALVFKSALTDAQCVELTTL